MDAKTRIHAFYILLILGAIIVGLLTVKWSEVYDLTGYLSFAATVSSTLLALVAIFYSMHANAGLAARLGELSATSERIAGSATTLANATAEVREAADKIPEVLKGVGDQLTKAADSITTSSSSVSQASTEIREVAAKIPGALLEVGTTVQATHQMMKRLSEAPTHKPAGEPGHRISEADAARFVGRASLVGLVALRACALSFERKRPFKIPDLGASLTYRGSSEYIYGFLIGFEGKGTEVNQVEGVFTVAAFDERLGDALLPEIEARTKSIAKSGDEESAKLFKENVAAVVKFFGG
jgi:hypothetical protein